MFPPRLLHTNRLSEIEAITKTIAARIAARGGAWVTMRSAPLSRRAHARRSEDRLEDLARGARAAERRAREQSESAPHRSVGVGRRDHRVRVVGEPGHPAE